MNHENHENKNTSTKCEEMGEVSLWNLNFTCYISHIFTYSANFTLFLSAAFIYIHLYSFSYLYTCKNIHFSQDNSDHHLLFHGLTWSNAPSHVAHMSAITYYSHNHMGKMYDHRHAHEEALGGHDTLFGKTSSLFEFSCFFSPLS